MTMLLTVEAIEAGKIGLNDMITCSEKVSKMEGSKVFLSYGEKISVDELLKSVAVASGNDAAVALAEYMAGSEEAFTQLMNNRAAELGMNDTHFMNATGLDAEGHYTSANDIAIMSRELIKHDMIYKYTTI
ncbi:D-alanyl-D-alanine carboxypeptidase DacF [bioreactor metagenome]|uniref:D-alanyl-D-alanine carboxypeptidase DacF n=1 Tax=bioreactor metagenome TaxID=1076179 RepID=A0A645JCB7_9ZZZZ